MFWVPPYLMAKEMDRERLGVAAQKHSLSNEFLRAARLRRGPLRCRFLGRAHQLFTLCKSSFALPTQKNQALCILNA